MLHIVSVDDEIIPAMSEKLVDGFIEKPDSDIQGEDSMLVETNVAEIGLVVYLHQWL